MPMRYTNELPVKWDDNASYRALAIPDGLIKLLGLTRKEMQHGGGL